MPITVLGKVSAAGRIRETITAEINFTATLGVFTCLRRETSTILVRVQIGDRASPTPIGCWCRTLFGLKESHNSLIRQGRSPGKNSQDQNNSTKIKATL